MSKSRTGLPAHLSVHSYTIVKNKDKLRQPSDALYDEEMIKRYSKVLRMRMLILGNKAVGLAGVQIGIPYRIFAVKLETIGNRIAVYVNPTIEAIKFPFSKATEDNKGLWKIDSLEGCLSLKGEHKVKRYRSIVLRSSNNATRGLQGTDAIRVQHEVDHLDGILITDRALNDRQKERKYNGNS